MEMKKINAEIYWRDPAQGGRSKSLDIGVRYFPTIVLDDDESKTHWSVVFETTPVGEDYKCKIVFELLVDNEETQRFEKKLLPGTHFCFHEGARIVACGTVI